MAARPFDKDLDLSAGLEPGILDPIEPGGERPVARGGRSGRRGGKPSNRASGSRRRKGSFNNGNSAANAEKLSSPQNPQVKALVRLRQRRARDQEGLTVIEEPLVLRRAWEAGYPLHAVYYCNELMTPAAKELLEDLRAALRAGQTSLKLVELGPDLLRKAAYRDQPDGLLAIAPQQKRSLEDLMLRENPLLVVLENVEKPGNLGAALRIADGVGADAVLVTGDGTDLFNPNVLRASRGAFFTVPAVHCHIGEARDFLHERGLKVLATTPDATVTYTRADLTGPLAVVLGCEHNGLSDAWLKDEGCQAVRIPMRGHGDSLNVATAAAVILYEAMRQRALA
ncbi:MAG: TrmH family RNA methyltransferase [Candidatus Krumholzibacteria bacterium]|jgi:TrmH family RNA methyltransferase|nr:TrmH family RNA methyltransferase [Candidatus Krumholzibacteria bacterium]